MPVVILVVGGAIASWASRRESQRMQSVETQVQAICRRIGDGRDVTGLLNKGNPTVEAITLKRLQRDINSPEAGDGVVVRVTPGEYDSGGGQGGGQRGPTSIMTPATHTAMLILGDVERLALRVHCDDPDQPIIVLGFIEPDPR